MAKLTQRIVDGLTLPEGKADHVAWDDDLPGFGLRLRAGGSAVWIAQYRIGKLTRRQTLGTRDTTSLSAARELARQVLAAAKAGRDPQGEKVAQRRRDAVTVAAMVALYLADRSRRHVSERAAIETARYLERYARPIHSRPVHAVTRAELAGLLAGIANDHGPIAANRAQAALSSFWTWCLGRGVADASPMVGMPKAGGTERSRERVLTEAELAELWRATAGPGAYPAVVRLLILTGQRREEVGSMRWDEIDADAALWRLPGNRTKNGRAHDVPLSDPALAELARCERVAGRPLVFGGGDSVGFQSWSAAKRKLDAVLLAARQEAARRAGLDAEAVRPWSPWTLHDIRRSVATHLAELGTQPHVVEAVLNHVSGTKAGVAGTYNRAVYAAEKRQALAMWADRVAELADGTPRKVQPLRLRAVVS